MSHAPVRTRTAVAVVLAALLALVAGAAVPASAAHKPTTTVTKIAPIPHDPAVDAGSNVRGTVQYQLRGNELRVKVRARGLAPNLPHAQHLHAGDTCPPASADADGDGIITVVEGVPFYGGIQVSLTTTGDTSGDSALALDRFPVADADGVLKYDRTITLTDAQVAGFSDLHYVVHGIDLNGNGAYDFSAGPSSLTDAAPLEATVPAGCGEVG